MSPHQAPTNSSSSSQSLQVQDGSQQPTHSHLTMPPPKPIGEGHQNPQSMASFEANRARCLSGNGSRRIPVPSPLVLAQASSPYINRPQSTLSAPWTPAPTTSDVHNRNSRSNSECSMRSTPSPSASPHHPSGMFPHDEMMNRYLTVNRKESSLAYMASIAIEQGVVQDGENMYARKCEEEGWLVQNRSGSDSPRTLGRSEEGRN